MFKKIRFGNIKNLKKYLLYSMGEIVIIVIGIFIALELDKLKVEKERRNHITEILKNAQYETQSAIQSSANFLQINKRRDLIANQILTNQLTLEDYIRDDNETYDISGITAIHYQTNLLDDFKKQIDYLSEPEVNIYKLLLEVERKRKIIETYTDNARDIVLDHKRYQKSNHDWYYSIGLDSMSDRKDYVYRLNNFKYKNFIRDFRTNEIIFKSRQLSFIQMVSSRILIKIINNLKVEELSSEQIDSVLQSNRLKKLSKIAPDSLTSSSPKPYGVFDDISMYFMIYNNSADTIQLRKENDSKVLMTVLPNKFSFNGLPVDTELSVFISDSLRTKYKTELNSYLFYE